jgi:MoaA/NifB/PqqE/SkfB family radical SAM enzyme
MTTDWHDDECDYCRRWVRDRGDGAVRRDPNIVASLEDLKAGALTTGLGGII